MFLVISLKIIIIFYLLLCGVDLDEPLLGLRGGVDGRCGFGAGLLGFP
jgi:hypothetical protein